MGLFLDTQSHSIDMYASTILSFLFVCLSNLYTERRAQTHDPMNKSRTPYRPSQPGAPTVLIIVAL